MAHEKRGGWSRYCRRAPLLGWFWVAAACLLPDAGAADDEPDAKSTLAARGVNFAATYIGEVMGNATGGLRRGAVYAGRLEVVLDADLGRLAGWKGLSFHANAYQIHGRDLSADYIGNLIVVSNIEAVDTTRLYEAWFEQKLFGDQVTFRFGQLAADTEFIITEYGAPFISSAFGWPVLTAEDMPSGGPAYPLATPGVLLKFEPTPRVTGLVALFNGDPAGPGASDPQKRNRYGLDFRLEDPPLLMAEGQFKYELPGRSGPLPGTLKLGGWHHFGDFADQRFGADGLSLADPSSSGVPKQHDGNYGLYGIIDQQIYRLPGEDASKGIAFFARVLAAPSDRNLIDLGFETGVTFSGLIQGRPDDLFGAAFTYARVSDRARAFDADAGLPIRDYEAALELTYVAQLSKNWTLQPDFQYIFNPGGGELDPSDGKPIDDAAIFGLRTTVTY